MNNVWSIEISRIFFAILSTLILGFISEFWLFSVVVHFVLYIGWILIQLRSFERWIRNGAHSKNAPDTSGIWAVIVQHIYRIQKKNKDRKQSLASLAKRYQAIMKALPDATIVLNENFEIEWANKIAEKTLGIDLARDTGHRVDNIIRDQLIQDLLNHVDHKAEVEMISPVDQQKTLILTKVEYGENQTLLIARDISQRIALQKMRKAFIANASHELRTPLTVISGYLEMLTSDSDVPPAIHQLLKNAHQQALRMDRILGDLLILSKLEEKGFSQDRGDVVDVADLLQRLVSDFRKTTAKDTHEIQLDVEKGLNLKIIEREFYSLCQNLLSNAVKYSQEGAKVIICWSLSETNGACLKVIDNGEGIAKEHLSRLTERFFRANVNRTRKVNGTGLGLSIVKHIMENYGGYLDIQSELTVGSTFTACFPHYRVQLVDIPQK